MVFAQDIDGPFHRSDLAGGATTSSAAPAPVKPFKITPFVARTTTPQGFGFYAGDRQHNVNLLQPTTWTANREATVSNTQLGLGWRSRSMAAVVGYVKPGTGSGPDAYMSQEHVQTFRPRAMVGLGLALRY